MAKFRKGSALNVKKILGVILGIYAVDYFTPLTFLDSVPFLLPISLILASYFLIISGRQLK